MSVKIGFQGIEGSNSETASVNMSERLGWTEVELVPLVSSRAVVDALIKGEIDYGVMAVLNHVAGTVQETEAALKNLTYTTVAADCLPIHHCLFVKDSSVIKLNTVASHIQALRQCRNNLQIEYPDAGLKEVEDTAIAARYLSEGVLSPDTGVLCRRDAGERYGLYLLRENMEDSSKNATEFIMIEIPTNIH